MYISTVENHLINHVHGICQGHIPSVDIYTISYAGNNSKHYFKVVKPGFLLLLEDLWRFTQKFDFYLILLMWYMLLWWHY